MNPFKLLKRGVVDENPLFIQLLSLCPTLAVTTQAMNGLGMGISTTFVLAGSNVVVSLIRKFVPSTVRIPCFIVIIATFVTLLEFLLAAFLPDLNNALGIFIPLIVVNCIVLARAESFASKNSVIPSFFDGIGMGLGLTVGLTLLGMVRELLGVGELFGITILPDFFPRTIIMILAPGAFIALGFMIALVNHMRRPQ
ncbi:MAG: RnfABCDGE type electron transport complex subunit E [Turicibacter sp.]|nr:RnfABCDGE type electron transport complex subunit E [Turicibacter sp.]